MVFAVQVYGLINFSRMKSNMKLFMKYLYRNVWREKYVTLSEVCSWIRQGKYQGRVDAVRGLCEVQTAIGMASGGIAADYLPKILPAQGEKGVYTGLVLLSFHIGEGLAALERLRKEVNLWE